MDYEPKGLTEDEHTEVEEVAEDNEVVATMTRFESNALLGTTDTRIIAKAFEHGLIALLSEYSQNLSQVARNRQTALTPAQRHYYNREEAGNAERDIQGAIDGIAQFLDLAKAFCPTYFKDETLARYIGIED